MKEGPFLLATSVLAIDNMRLVWVDREAARRESIGKRRQDGMRLRFRFAVYQPVVGVPTPRQARKRPHHPGIERVMQKEIGQEGTDDAALWSSLGAFHQGSIAELKRRCQPASDIEPHPFARRMFLQRPQKQRMVDVVEQALDVKLKNPVIPPATLARHRDGVQRGFTGPVAIRVWQK